MRSSSLLYLLELFAIVFGAMFINPPIPDSAGIFVIANPVAATGSHMTVQWSLEPEEQIDPLTLYMYQDFAGGGVWDPISGTCLCAYIVFVEHCSNSSQRNVRQYYHFGVDCGNGS